MPSRLRCAKGVGLAGVGLVWETPLPERRLVWRGFQEAEEFFFDFYPGKTLAGDQLRSIMQGMGVV